MKVLYSPQIDELFICVDNNEPKIYYFYHGIDLAYSLGWIENFMKANDINMFYMGVV